MNKEKELDNIPPKLLLFDDEDIYEDTHNLSNNEHLNNNIININ